MTDNPQSTTCTIVVPVFNAPEGATSQIAKDFKLLCEAKPEIIFDLVVVEDGSDYEKRIDQEALSKAIPNSHYVFLNVNGGKGAALRAGMEKANGDIIIYTDNDFPYTTESITLLIDALYFTNVVLAVGVRPQSYYDAIPAKRKRISKVLQLMNGIFIKLPTTDTQAGLKGFKKEVKSIFLSTTVDGFLFDLEFLKLTKRQNIKTALIEVNLKKSARLSKVKMNNLWEELKVYFGIVFN